MAANGKDAERDRQRLCQELDAELGSDWRIAYQPGSFGCHELLDRLALVSEVIETHIMEHPACVQNADWHALASRLAAKLGDLYQNVAAKHLAAQNEET